jgi:hypothetical protein
LEAGVADDVVRDEARVDNRLTKALEHDLRLRIMRFSIDRTSAVSPREAAEELPATLSQVAYHFHVLADVKALAPTEVAPVAETGQRRYSPNPLIFEIPMVKEILTPAPS